MSPALPVAAQKDFERAVSLFNEGRLATADGICTELIARFPLDAEIAHFGGVLANRMGHYEIAVQRLGRCLQAQPRSARSLAAIAFAHEQLGQLEEARSAFSAAIQAQPGFAGAQNGLGLTLRRMGRHAEALECFERAIALDERSAESRLNAGRVLLDSGRSKAAAARYREALSLAAGRVEVTRTCAIGLQQAGDLDSAAAAYRELLQRDPGDALSRSQLALVLEAQGREDEAMREIDAAIGTGAGNAKVSNAHGILLLNRSRWAEAVEKFERAVSLDPSFGDARVNLAMALRALGRRDEARAHMREAEEQLDPAGLARLALLHGELGDSAQCIELAERAVHAGGPLPDAHLALFTEMMRAGRMESGWREYLYRPSRGTEIFRQIAAGEYPPPLPHPLAGADVFIASEQGLGDMLLFLRFAKPLADAGARLHLIGLDPRLEPLVRRAMPVEIWPEGREPPSSATLVWAGDLPMFVRALDAGGAPVPLAIAPLPDRVERMRERLGTAGSPSIGIAWRAGTPPKSGPVGHRLLSKEIAPRALGESLAGLDLRFVSVQRLPSSESSRELQEGLGAPILDLADVNADLEDMLALLSLLDGYAGVSSANVHLLASLGRGGHILVPFPPDWRWQARGRSPLFERFETYRQTPEGDWDEALRALRAGLAAGGPR
jgi:tetratricopeptide (TPR) repeat protein